MPKIVPIIVFPLVALVFVVLTVIGMVHGYSPVPHWDMWDGYLDSHVKILDGDWRQWFAQHNEHRIFFSRLLFWVDISIFGGVSASLVPINFLLLAGLVLGFCYLARRLSLNHSQVESTHVVLVSSIVTIGFSWMQRVNLTWGFQSQLFLAYLFPFLSFCLLDTYSRQRQVKWFVLSLLLGVFSAGTMANGLLVLPILGVLGLAYRLGKREVLTLFGCSVLVSFLYFFDYRPNPGHGSLFTTLSEKPGEFVSYVLSYLGNPFYYMGFESDISARVFGFLFILAGTATFVHTLIHFKSRSLNSSLFVPFAYLAYVVGTAIATAGGRAIFGVHQAVASRYTTPTLFAWISLLLIGVNLFGGRLKSRYQAGVLAVVVVLLSPVQLAAVESQEGILFARRIAALALEMNIRDELYTRVVFPNTDWLFEIVEEPRARNLSIFGADEIVDVQELMGTEVGHESSSQVTGSIDQFERISGDADYVRVSGWWCDRQTLQTASSLLIVNEAKRVVGYAVVGYPRGNVTDPVGVDNAGSRGFKGYLLADEFGMMSVVDRRTLRSLDLSIPRLY